MCASWIDMIAKKQKLTDWRCIGERWPKWARKTSEMMIMMMMCARWQLNRNGSGRLNDPLGREREGEKMSKNKMYARRLAMASTQRTNRHLERKRTRHSPSSSVLFWMEMKSSHSEIRKPVAYQNKKSGLSTSCYFRPVQFNLVVCWTFILSVCECVYVS